MPGGAELFFIVLVIIMLFGSKKIPELARGLGKGMREIKNATGDIQREIREGAKDINDLKDKVNVEKQVKNLIKEDKEKKASVDSSQEPTANKEAVKGVDNVESNSKSSSPEAVTQTVSRRSPYEKQEPQNPTTDND